MDEEAKYPEVKSVMWMRRKSTAEEREGGVCRRMRKWSMSVK